MGKSGKRSNESHVYIDAASPEDFVSQLLQLGSFGLDTVNWEVGGKLDGREVCKGRPPSPVARFTRPRAQPQFRGGEVLGRGVYWFRPLGILRRGREWEVAASCKRAPPLTGWERVSVDVVHELLLAHARRYYHMYWPRGLPERPEELRHVAVPPEAITSLRTGEWLAVTPVGRRRWSQTRTTIS